MHNYITIKMTKISKTVLFGFFVACFVAAEAQKKHTNVDYLAFGYDIYRGNPHSTQGLDPGFKFGKIFDLTYNDGVKSSDLNWDIPDSVTMARIDACTLNFQSIELENMKSYQKSLEQEVTVTGGFLFAKFKASTDYKSMEKSMTSNADRHIYSSAVCDIYKARMSPYKPPKLHQEFLTALRNLPAVYNEREYFRFLDNFGTHAITELSMGARYGMISTISERAYNQMRAQPISTTFAASGALAFLSGKVESKTSVQKQWADTYTNAMTNYQMISVGAKPVAGGDGVAWAQQAIKFPMPLRYTLIPISEIVKPLYIRNLLDTQKMNMIRMNLETAANNYCSKHLKPMGLISDCAAPVEVRPAPKINSCRLCADSCGSNWPVDGGYFMGEKNWPKWAFTFNPGCVGSYSNNRINTGVHMCCQEVDNTNKGQCRVCASCGGDFFEDVGAVQVDEKWNYFVSAYDFGCAGASHRTRSHRGGGLRVCCQKDPICSLCSTCGGKWPHESGVLGANENWKDFFRGRGRMCEGEVKRNPAKEGMKWCCKTTGTDQWGKMLE